MLNFLLGRPHGNDFRYLLKRHIAALGAQVVRSDVPRDLEQPCRKRCKVAAVGRACTPGFLEGPGGQIFDVCMTAQSETKIVIDPRQLVSVEGIPIHILGRTPAQQFTWTRVFKWHRSIYVASASSLHPG